MIITYQERMDQYKTTECYRQFKTGTFNLKNTFSLSKAKDLRKIQRLTFVMKSLWLLKSIMGLPILTALK
jgi:transposase-like protein